MVQGCTWRLIVEKVKKLWIVDYLGNLFYKVTTDVVLFLTYINDNVSDIQKQIKII